MDNTVAYADEWAQEARNAGKDYALVRGEIQTRSTEHTPMYLGVCTGVTYDSKNDRYTAKFGRSTPSGFSTVKVTDEVAQFLLTHQRNGSNAVPTVYAHMTKGTIDLVLLMFLSRT